MAGLYLTGTAGNDMLLGSSDNDTLTGGAGNDQLRGEGGSDVYVYSVGDGSDSIIEWGTGAGEIDVLQLTDLNPGQITIVRSNYDMVLTVRSTGEVLTIDNQFESSNKQGFEEIRFADGTVWTKAQIALITSTGGGAAEGAPVFGGPGDDSLSGSTQAEFIYGDAGNDTLAGGDGNDGLYGQAGADVLEGGAGGDKLFGGDDNDVVNGGDGADIVYGDAGNDTLTGGGGNDQLRGEGGSDVYVYSAGDGSDSIFEWGTGVGEIDVLQLTDLNPGQISIVRSNYDMVLTVRSTGEVLTIDNQFESTNKQGFEEIRFADGTVWTKAQIALITSTGGGAAEGAPVLGGPGDDSLSGTTQAEFIYGDAGNDTLAGGDGNDGLYGQAGDDSLVGGLGNDTFFGGQGDDTLYGGQGVDVLNGEAGSDRYLYASGDGTETLTDNGSTVGEVDVLELTDLVPGQISLAASSYNLVITVKATGEKITISNQFESSGRLGVEEIRFADGSVWTKAQISLLTTTLGTPPEGAPIFGSSGDDDLVGTALPEFMYGDLGNDTLVAGDGNDGLYGQAGDDYLVGGSGNDTLFGGQGDDTLHGGQGADGLNGESGSDRYLYASGDGTETLTDNGSTAGEVDVLELTDLVPGQISLAASGYNLIITIKATGEKITVANQFETSGRLGVEEIRFADASVWTKAQISLLTTTLGTPPEGAPVLGGPGDDSLPGTALPEFMYGDLGNDTMAAGDGNDGLYGQAGNDSLVGGNGNDTFFGGQGDDTLHGGQGVDALNGEAGSDLYLYASGDGTETLTDNGAMVGEIDVLDLIDLVPGQISLAASSYNLIITIKATGEKITVTNQFESSGRLGVEEIRFADGSVWTKAQISLLTTTVGTPPEGAPVLGGPGDDSLSGTALPEFMYGDLGNDSLAAGDGNDGLYGQAGNDSLSGGEGADTIFGDVGDDTISGGGGADIIRGEAGSDLYRYATGDGSDLIYEWGTGTGETDILQLTDLNPGQVMLVRDDYDLRITVRPTGDVLTIDNQFESTNKQGFEEIRFANGTVWTKAQIALITTTGGTFPEGAPILGGAGDDSLTGTALPEFIYGDVGNDTIASGDGNDGLYGQAGNDSLSGGAGADTILGDAGDDTLNGGSGVDDVRGEGGSDTYLYSSGDGSEVINEWGTGAGEIDVLQLTDLNPGQITIVRSNYDMVLTVRSTGEVLTIDNQFESSNKQGFEEIRFADGTVWTKAQIALITSTGGGAAEGAPVFGGPGDDSLSGSTQAEFIYGDAGNDTLAGGDGNDGLYGQAGADVLEGGAGGDKLFGGDDNDVVNGGDGADIVYGDAGNDTLTGGGGNDQLRGEGGSDVYVYSAGDGSDSIFEWGTGVGEIDVLQLTDLNPGQISIVRSNYDMVLTVRSTGEVLTIDNQFESTNKQGFEEIRFADGTVWTKAQIALITSTGGGAAEGAPVLGGPGDDSLSGTTQAEFIYGDAGNDTIAASAGNDTLYGGGGDDLFVFSPGGGLDRIADFVAGGVQDQLDFSAFAGTGLSAVVAQVGANATITLGADVITLVGVNASQLVQLDPYHFN